MIETVVITILASCLAGNIQMLMISQRVTKLETIWLLACPMCDKKHSGRKTPGTE